VVVPESVSFVRAPAHPGCPGKKGHKNDRLLVGSGAEYVNFESIRLEREPQDS